MRIIDEFLMVLHRLWILVLYLFQILRGDSRSGWLIVSCNQKVSVLAMSFSFVNELELAFEVVQTEQDSIQNEGRKREYVYSKKQKQYHYT